MSHIFISYKREEQAIARKLADALEKEGMGVWWDPKLRAGEHYDDVIEKALNEAKCIIVMWSESSVQSRYVRDEATYALEKNKLVPVAIENVNLPLRFRGVQTTSLIGWDGSNDFSEFRKLVEDISTILVPQNLNGAPSEGNRRESLEQEQQRTMAHAKHKADETSLTFTVAPLVHINTTETQNAVSLANMTQQSFKFVFHPDTVSIQEDKYRLSNGALDLVSAVRDLTKKQNFKKLASGQLILVTSKADSDNESARDYATTAFENQCYFFHDTLPFAENIALVSTYIWEQLPPTAAIPTSASGRRALQPYLLLSFAVIALAGSMGAPIPYHSETLGCPLDYCDEVREIDRVFMNGCFCDECERIFEENRKKGKITDGRLGSARKLLLRTHIGRDS